MKAGKVLETAFKTDLFDADLIFDQQLTDMSHFYLINKLRISFAGPRLKITAKRMRTDIGHSSNFFGGDPALKMS